VGLVILTSQLFHAIGVVAVALGGLAWTLGAVRFGQRCLAFGVVLVVVAQALVHQGGVLTALIAEHGAALATIVLVLIALIALGRILTARRAREEPQLAGKRRVGRGP
jgi:hypothetical protein